MNDIFNVVALGPAAGVGYAPFVIKHFDLCFSEFPHHFQKLVWFDAGIGVGLAKRNNPLRNMSRALKHFFEKNFRIGF